MSSSYPAAETAGGTGRLDRPTRVFQEWSSAWRSRARVSAGCTVDDERVITFPGGLLGFPDHTRFALIQTGEENYFFWLQSVDEPNLAFVVTDPSIFFKDYEVPIREETPAGPAARPTSASRRSS